MADINEEWLITQIEQEIGPIKSISEETKTGLRVLICNSDYDSLLKYFSGANTIQESLLKIMKNHKDGILLIPVDNIYVKKGSIEIVKIISENT